MSDLPPKLRPLLDEFARQEGLPPDAAKHMREAIGSSPMLMRFMSQAREEELVERIRLSPPETNSGRH